ncbi:MAG: ethanolamine ammonia-lyase reactivating factor EutA [Sphingobacteriales bacterium]|nr:ethanolamine ammonia-lyase reactivating factor EutA [Sphingobacteriales bacterium]
MKLAGIDIGSNAVRLLIMEITERDSNPDKTVFTKDVLVRAPLRLGEQVFVKGYLMDDKINLLEKTMQAFANLMEVFEVKGYRACATSAMRDATNGNDIIERIREHTGVQIEILNGNEESLIVFGSYANNQQHTKEAFLNIDVGGGSTELVLFHDGKIIANRSFNIGTIRLLYEQVEHTQWVEMKAWLEEKRKMFDIPIVGVGSGGNINKVRSMYLNNSADKPLSINKLQKIYDELSSYSLEERMKELGLKPDRADVIVPATRIYLNVMTWGGLKKMVIPQIGVADGLVRQLYKTMKAKGQL